MFPKSLQSKLSVSFPPILIAGTLSSGLLELHACAGPTMPSSNPALLKVGLAVVVLLNALFPSQIAPVVTIFLSSQYSNRSPASGATPEILRPFMFNSASIIGILVLPIKEVTVTTVVFAVTGFPRPSSPSQGISLLPAVF